MFCALVVGVIGCGGAGSEGDAREGGLSGTARPPARAPSSTSTSTSVPTPADPADGVVVVLDPGHGGVEPGAIGPGGLAEKEVNLDVAHRAAELLRAEGVDVALTREGDTCASLGWRVRFAAARGARLLVSIHHNAEPDGPRDRPGSETYYQYRSADSKRLAGLAYEEAVGALAPFGSAWVGDTDAGAKWRRNDAGTDYYGILRIAASREIVATLVELAFVSNPPEEELLRRDDVRGAEAAAVARAVLRYLRTPDPGSGFTTPYPRSASGAPSKLSTCVDPPG